MCQCMEYGRATQRRRPSSTRTTLDLQGEGTMANTRVPDIALINLGFLLALKEAVVRDPVQAYYQFRLHPSDAAVIGDLGFDALESLALGLDQSIVTLRYTGQDLHDLIRTPPALRNIFATVRELVEPISARPGRSAPVNGQIHGSV